VFRLFSVSVISGQFRAEKEHPQYQEHNREFYQDDNPKCLTDFHIPEAVAIKLIYFSEDVHFSNLTKSNENGLIFDLSLCQIKRIMGKEINKGRRDALKTAGLFVAALVGTSIVNKLDAVPAIAEQNQQKPRIVRKAVFVSKNCKVHKQIASKAKNFEDCLLCIDACPRKAIVVTDIKGAKIKGPQLKEDLCIGCGRCVRVCPENPKGWEIWDRTNNKKLM
jgi:ferredoxin